MAGSSEGIDMSALAVISGDNPCLIDDQRSAWMKPWQHKGYQRQCVFPVQADDWLGIRQMLQQQGLFASHSLLDIRVSEWSKNCTQWLVAQLAVDCSAAVVVSGPRLSAAQKRSAWAKALKSQADWYEVWPPKPAEARRWLMAQAQAAGITLSSEVAEQLLQRQEGNYAGLRNTIALLAIDCPGQAIQLHQLEGVLRPDPQRTLMDLPEACLSGQRQKSLHIIDQLRHDGCAPVLVLWSLVRAIRVHMPGSGAPVWMARQQTRKPWPVNALQTALQHAMLIDHHIKGLGERCPWQLLQRLVVWMCRRHERL